MWALLDDQPVNRILPKWMKDIMFRSPKFGAQTSLFTAFSNDEAALVSGKYFENCGLSEHNLSSWAKNVEQRRNLWEASVRDTDVDLKVGKFSGRQNFKYKNEEWVHV